MDFAPDENGVWKSWIYVIVAGWDEKIMGAEQTQGKADQVARRMEKEHGWLTGVAKVERMELYTFMRLFARQLIKEKKEHET